MNMKLLCTHILGPLQARSQGVTLNVNVARSLFSENDPNEKASCGLCLRQFVLGGSFSNANVSVCVNDVRFENTVSLENIVYL